jgi:hypothetical protein
VTARKHRRLVLFAILIGTIALANAGAAFANGGQAMAVDVTSSGKQVDAQSGNCTWTVTSDITVVNLTGSVLTYQAVAPRVSWTGPGGTSGVVDSGIIIVTDGGLHAADTLAAHGQQTYSQYTVQFVIPCAATSGNLAVQITTDSGTGAGDAPFLENGSAVPALTLGALAGVSLLGVVLVARRRSPSTVRS